METAGFTGKKSTDKIIKNKRQVGIKKRFACGTKNCEKVIRIQHSFEIQEREFS